MRIILDVQSLFSESDFDVEHEAYVEVRPRDDRRVRRPKRDKKNKLRD